MGKKNNRIKSDNVCPIKKTSIGGQALMEGIMMRGPQMTAMVVRNPKGEIVIEKFPTVTKKRSALYRIPIIRGVFNFASSMALGYRCLMRSAEISGLEEAEAELAREKEEKKAAKRTKKASKKGIELEEKPSAEQVLQSEDKTPGDAGGVANNSSDSVNGPVNDKPDEKKKTSPMMIIIMVLSVVFAVIVAVGLFIFLPTFLYGLLGKAIPSIANNRYLMSVFEGVLRVVLLVGYMASVALMKDIRRTFMYHGAEHKTIFCYENGKELTVENVRLERRFHPRCGTSFLILMVLVSIFVGFFIPPAIPKLYRSLIKIALVPVIVGIGYELIKFCGRHDNWLTRVISAPGVALQHITVFEPDDDMIECAIASIKEVIPEDDSDAW